MTFGRGAVLLVGLIQAPGGRALATCVIVVAASSVAAFMGAAIV